MCETGLPGSIELGSCRSGRVPGHHAAAPARGRVMSATTVAAVTVSLRENQRRVADPLAFMLAGNAIFTLVSKATGARFTYRVRVSMEVTAQRPNHVYFVCVLTGPNNASDYTYLGTIFADATYSHGRKSAISSAASSALAFRWFMDHVHSDQVEVFHQGRCCRCGRKLTVPSSIESGIGPECAGRKPS